MAGNVFVLGTGASYSDTLLRDADQSEVNVHPPLMNQCFDEELLRPFSFPYLLL